MSRRTIFATAVGAVLFVAGFALGLVPVRSAGGEACGRPFASKVDQLRDRGGAWFDRAADECGDTLAARRVGALVLAVAGGVVLLTAVVVVAVDRSREPG